MLYSKVKTYAQNTFPGQMLQDAGALLKQPETYEQIISLAIPVGASKAATLGKMAKASLAARLVNVAKPATESITTVHMLLTGKYKDLVVHTQIIIQNRLQYV